MSEIDVRTQLTPIRELQVSALLWNFVKWSGKMWKWDVKRIWGFDVAL